MNSRNVIQAPSPKPPAPATKAQITALAHEIWRERGSPDGSDLDIWLEAERELNGGQPLPTRDSIPADPANPGVDSDPVIAPRIDREFRGSDAAGDRGPTAYGIT